MVPTKTNQCLFLDPGILAATSLKLEGNRCTEYLSKAMHYALEESKKFILVPYHQRLLPTFTYVYYLFSCHIIFVHYLYILIVILLCPSSGHWCLIVIVPTENQCVIMDSSRPKDKSIKIHVARAIFPYINK